MQTKKKDEYKRQRNVTICFRMSPKEKEELHNRIKLCGKTKQDYMIKSTLHQQLVVVGNKKVLEEFKSQLYSIELDLRRLASINELGDDKLCTLKTILEIMLQLNQ